MSCVARRLLRTAALLLPILFVAANAAAAPRSSPVGVAYKGWSQRAEGPFRSDFTYGLLIGDNTSKDAFGVSLHVWALSARGSVVAQDLQTITRIPAQTAFGVGDTLLGIPPSRITHLRVVVKVRRLVSASHIPMPSALRVRRTAGDAIDGVLWNPFRGPIDPLGVDFWVIFISNNAKILGGFYVLGGQGFIGQGVNAIYPGRTAPFELVPLWIPRGTAHIDVFADSTTFH
jgi:hypothetical protein